MDTAGSIQNSQTTPTAGLPTAVEQQAPWVEPKHVTLKNGKHVKAKDQPQRLKELQERIGVLVQVRDTLGLPRAAWTRKKLEALDRFEGVLLAKQLGKVRLVLGFDSLKHINHGQKVLVGMSKDKKLDASVRIAAVEAMASAAKSFVMMSDHIGALVKTAEEKMAENRPRNLPPPMPVQINLSGKDSAVKFAVPELPEPAKP